MLDNDVFWFGGALCLLRDLFPIHSGGTSVLRGLPLAKFRQYCPLSAGKTFRLSLTPI